MMRLARLTYKLRELLYANKLIIFKDKAAILSILLCLQRILKLETTGSPVFENIFQGILMLFSDRFFKIVPENPRGLLDFSRKFSQLILAGFLEELKNP